MAIDFPNSPTTNQLYQSGNKTWLYDGEKWTLYIITAVVDSTPVGALQAYAGTSAPTGWLMAYGQAISRSTYSGLYTVIGTTYGNGDGSTTFNLPDLRGRVPAGVDNMGGSAASRLTSTVLSASNTLGATGGVETVTLTSAQSGVPAHGHGTTGTENYSSFGIGYLLNSTGRSFSVTTANPALVATVDGQSHTHTVNNNTAANASQAHTNTQPTIVMNYIIKYGPSSTVDAANDQIFLPTQIFS